MLGLKGISVDAPEQVGRAWDEALAADRPVVLEAHTGPEVPPLPPHITFEQAKGLMSSMLGGEAHPASLLGSAFRQMFPGAAKK